MYFPRSHQASLSDVSPPTQCNSHSTQHLRIFLGVAWSKHWQQINYNHQSGCLNSHLNICCGGNFLKHCFESEFDLTTSLHQATSSTSMIQCCTVAHLFFFLTWWPGGLVVWWSDGLVVQYKSSVCQALQLWITMPMIHQNPTIISRIFFFTANIICIFRLQLILYHKYSLIF